MSLKTEKLAESGTSRELLDRGGVFCTDVEGLSDLRPMEGLQRRREDDTEERLQKRYALSEQGAKDLIKGCLACVLQNLSFMLPVGLLYSFVSDMMGGGVHGRPDGVLHRRLCGVRRADPADDVSPVQRHLFCHLCGKRRAADYAGGAAAEDPAVLLRKEGPGRSDQHHHG